MNDDDGDERKTHVPRVEAIERASVLNASAVTGQGSAFGCSVKCHNIAWTSVPRGTGLRRDICPRQK